MNMTTNSCSFDLREINFQFKSRQSQFDSSNRQKLDKKFEYILYISLIPPILQNEHQHRVLVLFGRARSQIRQTSPLMSRGGLQQQRQWEKVREKWMERETTKSVSLNAISKRSRYMWIHLRSKDQLNKLKERLLIILRFFTFSKTSSWIVASVDSCYFRSAVLRVVVVQRATSSSYI